jgi:asparagine synthase (glutamine-hydrolysing)
MSVQFGRWNFNGQPCAPEYLEKVGASLAPYGPDSNEAYSKNGVQVLYRAFYTTKESRREKQPHISQSGLVITWDGRLDNRSELFSQLRSVLSSNSTDVEIVAAAFERWGNRCLEKLIGDWALSVWNPNDRSVLLAKDPMGTHRLYYSMEEDHLTWSTTLDPLVLFAGKQFEICEKYIAGWFSAYPATHLTPYAGVYSVSPSCSVSLRPGKCMVSKYWDFDPEKRIRYRTDPEYEEHFRSVFAKAVQRKLRSDSPVLSELSGGRDSSSIVCMADTIIARGQAECPRLDTISYYDDSEPNWNERPYFTKVEEKRGRKGWHIGAHEFEKGTEVELPGGSYAPAPNYPGYDGRTSSQIRACLASQGNRVLLSGIGGDEVMGGAPTETPELQDLLVRGQLRTLARQLKAWALEKRKPWIHLFRDAAREFLPLRLGGLPKEMRSAFWLQPRFVKRHWEPLHGYVSRARFFGPLPSFQANVGALDMVRRQLGQVAPPFEPTIDKRYPYLDRDLLEFIFAIPREQLLRPTQRRSLMRRALIGIVPDEILNRKTKAFVERAPHLQISRDWAKLAEETQNMMSVSLGIVHAQRISEALHKAKRADDDKFPILILMRTFWVEGWLKVLRSSGLIKAGPAPQPQLAWQTSVQN